MYDYMNILSNLTKVVEEEINVKKLEIRFDLLSAASSNHLLIYLTCDLLSRSRDQRRKRGEDRREDRGGENEEGRTESKTNGRVSQPIKYDSRLTSSI